MQSCGDENNPVNSGPPFIESISKATTFVGDTITVFGANLGARSDSSYVLIDTLRFSSHDCLKWTAAVVALEVPIGASSGTFAIVTDGVMSNKLQISVAPLPPYETVQVSAGSFMMGSATGLADESPVHEVTLTRGLEVAATEVTLQLWNSVMHDMPKEMTAKNLPVAGIEWAEAALFCNELSKIEGRDTCYIFNGGTVEFDTSSAGWRLPTEAEWEYLCRGGSDGDFAGPGNPDEMGWYSANSGYRAQPVAEKSANAWGIHDMHGNLWEWCWDYYSADYYEQSAPIDPLGPESGSRRVLRGGSYADGLALMRSANRRANDIPKEHCGIRIVRFTD